MISAQIEGTQCTFDDILNPENTQLIQRNVADVISYVQAAEYALNRLETLPLCTRLLKEVHGILLDNTRGKEKSPGELRTSQNWIGPTGCTLNEASYIPPNLEDMADALYELDRFINEPYEIDPIVKAALIHYQFETIHPFLDGNGRLGRLLITLSLVNDHALSGIIFYPSYMFKLRRNEYYQSMMDVRQNGNYSQWIDFFCECLYDSALDAINSLEQLVDLRKRNTEYITANLGRAAINGQRLLKLLEENPICDINFIAKRLDIARTTANNLVESFENIEILKKVEKDKQRYRLYMYDDYLSILRKGGELA